MRPLAAAHPPRLEAGDALNVLPALVGEMPSEAEICVLHCHTLNQFNPAGRARFAALLAGAGRSVTEVAIQWSAGERAPRLNLTRYRDGRVREALLGHCDAHGEWLAWGPVAQ